MDADTGSSWTWRVAVALRTAGSALRARRRERVRWQATALLARTRRSSAPKRPNLRLLDLRDPKSS
eukprot:6852146-Prymnesium_polylepis.1